MAAKKKVVKRAPSLALEQGVDEFDLLREAILLTMAEKKRLESRMRFYKAEFRRFQRVRKALRPLLKSLQTRHPGCLGCIDSQYIHRHILSDRVSVLGQFVLNAQTDLLTCLPHLLAVLK